MREHIDGKREYVCVRASIRTRANSGIKTFMSALMHMKFRFYETFVK